MKKVKNYIDAELAKKKIARYKYWSIKDENGITICSCDDNNDERVAFCDMLDKIILDNVDAEVQVKYGTSEQSSRHNPPFFIHINDTIEWIDPEPDDTVTINGVAHKVDRNGNVNINLAAPEVVAPQVLDPTFQIDTFRQEMDVQLQGIRREYELKEDKWNMNMQNKLMEQTIKFREMMLSERETRIAEKEQVLSSQQTQYDEREEEVQDDVRAYLRQVPTVLGGLIKELLVTQKENPLAGAKKPKREPVKRNKAKFSFEKEEQEEVEAIIPEERITQEELAEMLETEEVQTETIQEDEDI